MIIAGRIGPIFHLGPNEDALNLAKYQVIRIASYPKHKPWMIKSQTCYKHHCHHDHHHPHPRTLQPPHYHPHDSLSKAAGYGHLQLMAFDDQRP